MRVTKLMKDFPILVGIEVGGQLACWCPYCVKFHYHGNLEGVRVAHCTNKDSPFNQTGYYIKRIPKTDPVYKIIKHN